MYDNCGEFYCVVVVYGVNYYEVLIQWFIFDVYYDLNFCCYLVIGLDNEEFMYDFSVCLRDVEFMFQVL